MTNLHNRMLVVAVSCIVLSWPAFAQIDERVTETVIDAAEEHIVNLSYLPVDDRARWADMIHSIVDSKKYKMLQCRYYVERRYRFHYFWFRESPPEYAQIVRILPLDVEGVRGRRLGTTGLAACPRTDQQAYDLSNRFYDATVKP